MSHREERMLLRGRLAELKMKQMELAGRADANIRATRQALASAAVSVLADIDLDGALVNLGEAVEARREYLAISDRIGRIEKELE